MPMPFILDVHLDVLDLYDVAISRLLPNNIQRLALNPFGTSTTLPQL